MAAKPPVVTPLLSRLPHTGPRSGSPKRPELEGGAEPEADAGHDHFLPVGFGLDDGAGAVHEQGSGYHNQIAGHHRAGDGAEQPGNFGQEGQDDENEADEVPHPQGGYAGDLGEGNDAGMDDNRHGAGDAGQEVADSGAGQGTLHLAEIDGAGVPPGHPLQSDGFAVGLYGDNQAQKEEGRQQGPEGDAEVRRRLQARPALGDADPGGVHYRREVKDAHSGGHNAAGHDADDRRPQAQGRGKAQRKAGDDDQRGQGRQRGGDGLGRRRIVQQAEDHRSQRDGEYHHHRAAYGGRYDAPEDEQPAGDDDLHHCGDDNQGGKGGRAAVGHRRDAEGDGEGGGEHRHGGAGAGGPQRDALAGWSPGPPTATTQRPSK